MKLFVSYRRDDTGGRAGRLVDALVARFGARNVFQDVNAVAPGYDFRAQVEAAIASSDAVLIVIGRGWLGIGDAGGGRRIDDEDDFVRLEVSTALSSGIPVVPVLVDRAGLPSPDELPEDMSPMLGRQAVTIRDASWHQDVDDVVRRLKGEERVTAPARRWRVLTGVGLLILVVVFVVAAVVRNPGEESSESPPECDLPDDTWSAVELAAEPFDDIVDDEHTFEFEAQEAAIGGADNTQVVVKVAVTKITDDRSDTDVPYFYGPRIEGLLVDGVSSSRFCFGPVDGNQQLDPGERVIAWISFHTKPVPSGAKLILELVRDGSVDIGTSP